MNRPWSSLWTPVYRGVDSSEVTQVRVYSLRFFTGVAVVSVLCGGSAGVAKEEPDFVRITPAEVRWRDIPDSHGARQAILLGDPEKPGMYVVRAKFPPHVMDAPHWHPWRVVSQKGRAVRRRGVAFGCFLLQRVLPSMSVQAFPGGFR